MGRPSSMIEPAGLDSNISIPQVDGKKPMHRKYL
jgi:hypothetical protein